MGAGGVFPGDGNQEPGDGNRRDPLHSPVAWNAAILIPEHLRPGKFSFWVFRNLTFFCPAGPNFPHGFTVF